MDWKPKKRKSDTRANRELISSARPTFYYDTLGWEFDDDANMGFGAYLFGKTWAVELLAEDQLVQQMNETEAELSRYEAEVAQIRRIR